MDIHIEAHGSGPPVLFIHAGVADCRMWSHQFDLPGYRSIAFDMRGYGQSPLGTTNYSNANDTLTVLDTAGVDKAVVVGCSIGGGVALQVTEMAPDRVSGLVLVGANAPGYEPEVDYESPQWPDAVEAFEEGDFQRAAELEAEIWLAGIGRSISDLDPALVDLFIEMDLTALANETERDRLETATALTTIPEIGVPVSVIVGERDIPQLRLAAAHLAMTFYGGPETVIADSAHLPSIDRPEEFNRLLLAFLDST